MNMTKRIKAFFILMKADRELKRVIKQADRLYLKNGRRYYVLPNLRHELHAYCWADIKRMRRAGMFSNRATQRDFLFESFYHTADAPTPQAETQCLAQLRGAGPVPDLKNHPQMLRFSNHKLYLCSKIK